MQDFLKRPVKIGDLIITKGYYTTANIVTTVVKVNRKTIAIDIPDSWAIRYNQNYPDRTPYPETKRLNRRSDQVIVVTEQDAYNRDNYPEYYI